jgi:hypothetical protein
MSGLHGVLLCCTVSEGTEDFETLETEVMEDDAARDAVPEAEVSSDTAGRPGMLDETIDVDNPEVTDTNSDAEELATGRTVDLDGPPTDTIDDKDDTLVVAGFATVETGTAGEAGADLAMTNIELAAALVGCNGEPFPDKTDSLDGDAKSVDVDTADPPDAGVLASACDVLLDAVIMAGICCPELVNDATVICGAEVVT